MSIPATLAARTACEKDPEVESLEAEVAAEAVRYEGEEAVAVTVAGVATVEGEMMTETAKEVVAVDPVTESVTGAGPGNARGVAVAAANGEGKDGEGMTRMPGFA